MAPAKRPSKLSGLARELDADEISSDSLVSFMTERKSTDASPAHTRRGRGRPPVTRIAKSVDRAASGRANSASTSRRSVQRALHQDSVKDATQKSQQDRKSTQDTQSQGRGRGRPKANNSTSISRSDKETGSHATGNHEIPDSHHLVRPEEESAMDAVMDEMDDVISPQKPTLSSPTKRTTMYIETETQLRRRIGDLTRRCETWESKYRELRDLGIKEAEAIFDRLKQQTDERSRVADSLVSQLQLELSAQRSLAQEGQLHKEQLIASESKLSELTASLAEARQEIKSLSVKQSAARAAETALPGAKIPGSAVKGPAIAARAAAAAASSDALQVAQLKEDMYSDLTGLIIRGVKREKSTDAFDCIQTGKNGSLHFKLTIEKEETSEGYDETQFTFEPQLDEDRDKALIGFLPDYLTDEITFPRGHAPRFFQRLTRALEEQLG